MAKRRSYKKNPFKFKLKKKTLKSLGGILLFFLGGLITLSLLGVGSLSGGIRDDIFLVFGWTSLFLPVLLFTAGVWLLKLRIPFLTLNLFFGLFLFTLSLGSISAALFTDSAGVVGSSLWSLLKSSLTDIGAIFVLLLSAIAGLMILFNTSLDTPLLLFSRGFNGLLALSKWVFSRKQTESKTPFINEPKPIVKAKESTAEKDAFQPNPISNLPMEDTVWEYPPITLLSESIGGKASRGDLKHNAALIEKTLDSFGIQARVVEVNSGPSVTQYALEIALGTKLTKITALANDIALTLAAPTGTVRIEAPIPGKSLVGIEVPNKASEIVPLRGILSSENLQKAKSKLTLALGLDVSGSPMVADLAKMPHVLIAGATGSGKSVCINAFIATLLFRASPQEVKMILIDPKIVELSGWNGIPHLLTPVITKPEKVLSALRWATSEMDRRYKLFAEVGSRNIDQYNEMSGFQALPYIVILIDELADLMMFAPVEIEDAIIRLAQMSRATGIHLILATQRPSVDVLTGLIKANVPTRVAFNVTSQIDSRVIIDQPGAEKLLGRGDMLYVPPDASKPQRIQGVYVSEPELNRLIDFLKKTGVEPQYTEEVVSMPVSKMSTKDGGQDELFEDAVKVITQYDRASASLLQRRLRVGYARAARLLDELEAAGIVGIADGSKARDVLVRDAGSALGVGDGEEA